MDVVFQDGSRGQHGVPKWGLWSAVAEFETAIFSSKRNNVIRLAADGYARNKHWRAVEPQYKNAWSKKIKGNHILYCGLTQANG